MTVSSIFIFPVSVHAGNHLGQSQSRHYSRLRGSKVSRFAREVSEAPRFLQADKVQRF